MGRRISLTQSADADQAYTEARSVVGLTDSAAGLRVGFRV